MSSAITTPVQGVAPLAPVTRSPWLRPKYLLFAFIGLMYLYVLGIKLTAGFFSPSTRKTRNGSTSNRSSGSCCPTASPPHVLSFLGPSSSPIVSAGVLPKLIA